MQNFDVCEHVLYSLCNARLKMWPFPHLYAENVFPIDFYYGLREKLRSRTDFYVQKGTNYNGRKFAGPEMDSEVSFMQSKRFLEQTSRIFLPLLKDRYKGRNLEVFTDLRFIRDCKDYFIGPHTDARWKIASFLFYLPDNALRAGCGTTLYVPNDPAFLCDGGPHHRFEDFKPVYTAPYVPNTCFAFLKTANSFHGVPPLPIQFDRDVLLYNIYDREIYEETHSQTAK